MPPEESLKMYVHDLTQQKLWCSCFIVTVRTFISLITMAALNLKFYLDLANTKKQSQCNDLICLFFKLCIDRRMENAAIVKEIKVSCFEG